MLRPASLRTILPLAAAACLALPAGADAFVLHYKSPPPTPGGAYTASPIDLEYSPEGYPVLHPGPLAVASMKAVFGVAGVHLPVVTSFSPRKVKVGQVLTIHGKYFRPGFGKNFVVFQRAGGRYVFVKAGKSTSTSMQVRIPATLTSFLARTHGAAIGTTFRIRILASRFGPAFTAASRSPVIEPPAGGSTTAPSCDPTGKGLPPNGDADHDGLPNALELQIHTNPCNPDTDGDGLSDFWEYKSALDYNSDALPYPGKRPYPNPLDPTDANIDFDGDGMTAAEEYAAWAKCGNKDINKPLFMSDGTQSSMQVVTTPDTLVGHRLDINGNGILTDDERDSDLCDPTGIKGDGLGNWVEQHGPMVPDWWTAVLANSPHPEKPYGLSRFAKTDWLDPDTDGDGVLDGADDSDHDGWSNQDEVYRHPLSYNNGTLIPGASVGYWVQPFNPCLPDPHSRTCSLHIPIDPQSAWPPFDRGIAPGTPTPYRMSDVTADDPT